MDERAVASKYAEKKFENFGRTLSSAAYKELKLLTTREKILVLFFSIFSA